MCTHPSEPHFSTYPSEPHDSGVGTHLQIAGKPSTQSDHEINTDIPIDVAGMTSIY